ncbi:MAG: 50S ribosomal protein L14e [Candidatus Micrarchaeota archaeon]|nr:50S ribosomal protein L14e [Candidatus Micrarchaeota archaeon]
MTLLEEGRVCIKKAGRDAGSKVVVTKVIDERFVNIIAPHRPKERKCNVSHLEILNEKVDPKDRVQINKIIGVKERPETTTKKGKA